MLLCNDICCEVAAELPDSTVFQFQGTLAVISALGFSACFLQDENLELEILGFGLQAHFGFPHLLLPLTHATVATVLSL